MKNILKKVSIILLGGMLVMNVGCARKGSREWIEKQISDIERVYPTEDAEDLFEKFPNGFRISQTRLFQENGKKYSITLEMKGDKNTKKITEKVKKSTSKTEPYKEIVEKESEVKYKKGENLVLAKPELTEEFKKLEATEGTFSYDTYRYDVVYKITNNEINNYLGFSNEEVSMEVFGQYSENDKTYFHTLAINDKDKKLHFFEKVVEDKGNTEDDAE